MKTMSFDMMPPISRQIWERKYRFKKGNGASESSIEESWRRLARAIAQGEAKSARAEWEARFYDAL